MQSHILLALTSTLQLFCAAFFKAVFLYHFILCSGPGPAWHLSHVEVRSQATQEVYFFNAEQ